MLKPSGVSEADFRQALEKFAGVVGAEWVLTSPEDLEPYKDPYSPFKGEDSELVASAAVAPDTAEEVQEIVRIANSYGIPLYPISTGKNLGYGGPAPVHSGSVVLDLKRLNRILEIDEKAGTVLVEPGVSYFDLYKYIQERGLKLWIDVPDPGWGSVIGNALDGGNGGTLGIYRMHFDAHCGMEVVLPDGEILRTGMGAMPNAQTWQQYRWGFGPYLDGLFRQSNMGVVTKMGFWLLPQPESFMAGTVLAPRFGDLDALIDIKNFLEDSFSVMGLMTIGSPLFANADMTNPRAGAIYVPRDADIAKLEADAAAKGGFWSLTIPYYGNQRVNEAQWEYAKELFRKRIPGVTFQDTASRALPASLDDIFKSHLYPMMFGIPTLFAFHMGSRSALYPNPSSGHMWFSPVIPRTAEAIIEAQRVLVETIDELKLPLTWFGNIVSFWPRGHLILVAMPISDKPEENLRLREGYKKLIAVAAERGWGEYRTAPAFQDMVSDTYSYNNHISRRVAETLKDALDPKGILSAGRYGVWPRHLRKK